MTVDVKQVAEKVAVQGAFVKKLQGELGKAVIGQQDMLDGIMVALLCNGHVLLEGVPGLAKTLTVNTLARALRVSFQRLQFTPDLLPADLVGTQIYRPQDGTFYVRQGPLFANIVLADEINRAPAKVQSALLEAMQERQVTIGDETFALPRPFMVLATQNPIEQEGTYPLPEAQVDRFMLKLKVGYPSKDEERRILDLMATSSPEIAIDAVVGPEDILAARAVVDEIYVDDSIKDYIVNLVDATRQPAAYGLEMGSLIAYGASPRATIYLTMAARAAAFLQGRGYVTPQDVKAVALNVLRHRVIPSYEAEAEEKAPEDLVQTLLDNIEVP